MNRAEDVGPSKYPQFPGAPERVEALLEVTLINLITQLLLSGRMMFPLKGSIAIPKGLLNLAKVAGPFKYPQLPGTPAMVETILEVMLINLITQFKESRTTIFPSKGSIATPFGLLKVAEVVGPSWYPEGPTTPAKVEMIWTEMSGCLILKRFKQ